MSTVDADRAVAIVIGTRPEAIKVALVVRLLGGRAFVVHTGQHFDEPLRDESILRRPDVQLEVGGPSRGRGQQLGMAISQVSTILEAERPRVVVVQGDTNSALAGAWAANALSLPLVHIEAGLRSFDRLMPEEHNRHAIDHLSDLCCAPTPLNVENLTAEGIPPERLAHTGNTVVEAVHAWCPPAIARTDAVRRRGLPGRFVLMTLHRPENVDDLQRLRLILKAIRHVQVPVVFPVHPRTAAVLESTVVPPNLLTMPPVDYSTFLSLMCEAAGILSDSGGVQEEVSVLKRYAVILRRSTERPEVLGSFADLTDEPSEAVALVNDGLANDRSLGKLESLPSPYGDGSSSARIVERLNLLLD